MDDINAASTIELYDHAFLDCCKNHQTSLESIKPHIMAFAKRIKKYSIEILTELEQDEFYRIYQLLDDLAHLKTDSHLAAQILDDPEIQRELPAIRSYYSNFFNIHEELLAEELFQSDMPWETLNSFPLYARYETMVISQIKATGIAPNTTMAFIGCGPVPITLIIMNRLYGIRSIGLEISGETTKISRKVIKCLGLEDEIQIIHGDESALRDLEWDMVSVAAMSEPKARIFQTLREILKERSMGVPVIFRTYTGMRAILYKPVQSEDIEGFTIVKRILPTERVNNTIIFAEVAG
ncbi:MAG: nicotianamine synthase [Desulfobacteraceae bacterium]|nr:nicotianamine synthase [Desulfobacteraceae bacterium]